MVLMAASWLTRVVAVYLLFGIVFAIPFTIKGVGRIDPVAQQVSWGFRLCIFPGSVAFWPWLLKRWWKNESPKEEVTPHRQAGSP